MTSFSRTTHLHFSDRPKPTSFVCIKSLQRTAGTMLKCNTPNQMYDPAGMLTSHGSAVFIQHSYAAAKDQLKKTHALLIWGFYSLTDGLLVTVDNSVTDAELQHSRNYISVELGTRSTGRSERYVATKKGSFWFQTNKSWPRSWAKINIRNTSTQQDNKESQAHPVKRRQAQFWFPVFNYYPVGQ